MDSLQVKVSQSKIPKQLSDKRQEADVGLFSKYLQQQNQPTGGTSCKEDQTAKNEKQNPQASIKTDQNEDEESGVINGAVAQSQMRQLEEVPAKKSTDKVTMTSLITSDLSASQRGDVHLASVTEAPSQPIKSTLTNEVDHSQVDGSAVIKSASEAERTREIISLKDFSGKSDQIGMQQASTQKETRIEPLEMDREQQNPRQTATVPALEQKKAAIDVPSLRAMNEKEQKTPVITHEKEESHLALTNLIVPSSVFKQSLPENLLTTTQTIQLDLSSEKRMVEGIVKHFAQNPQEGVKELTIRLNPASMGEVTIQMKVSDSQVDLVFNVQTAQVKEMFEGVSKQFVQAMDTLSHRGEQAKATVLSQFSVKEAEIGSHISEPSMQQMQPMSLDFTNHQEGQKKFATPSTQRTRGKSFMASLEKNVQEIHSVEATKNGTISLLV